MYFCLCKFVLSSQRFTPSELSSVLRAVNCSSPSVRDLELLLGWRTRSARFCAPRKHNIPAALKGHLLILVSWMSSSACKCNPIPCKLPRIGPAMPPYGLFAVDDRRHSVSTFLTGFHVAIREISLVQPKMICLFSVIIARPTSSPTHLSITLDTSSQLLCGVKLQLQDQSRGCSHWHVCHFWPPL